MPFRAFCRLSLLPLALLWLQGCGQGDTIPLVGAGNVCDRPEDPRWHTLSPLGGLLVPQDGVALSDSLVCLVGRGGLALWKEGGQLFERERVGTDRNLNCAAATAAGEVLAVGDDGVLARRSLGGLWQVRRLAPGRAFSRVSAGAEACWAVGAEGLVATGTADPASWEVLGFPESADLTGVAARRDTVVVCGREGCLYQRRGEQWQDLSDGPWGDHDIKDVWWPEDGRLLVLADSLYLRVEAGWQVPRTSNESLYAANIVRAKAGQRYLWVQTEDRIIRVDRSQDPWLLTGYYFFDKVISFVPAGPGRLLILQSQGQLIWRTDTSTTYDPAGHADLELFQLADGTTGAWDELGLLVVQDGRLVRALSLDSGDHPRFWYCRAMKGQSLDDFYYLTSGMLIHCRNGVSTEVVDLDIPLRDMGLDEAGHIHLSATNGLYRWDGNEATLLLPKAPDDPHYELQVTAAGTLVAFNSLEARYLTGEGWAPMAVRYTFLACEVNPGDLVLFRSAGEDVGTLWRKSVGLLREWDYQPFAACPELRFRGGWDSPHGLHVFSSEPGLVLRQVGDPRDRNWDLVAGATSYEIDSIIVLPDGAVLADCTDPEALLYYPSR